MQASWSANQYLAFEDERTRPVRDLLAALPAIAARRAIDIGCGPGNSTELLARRFPAAVVSGLDSSGDMIEAARRRLPNLAFEETAIERWLEGSEGSEGSKPRGEAFDVILANAVLQWVPDHLKVLSVLVDRLAPGGALAVQVPDNFDEPAHYLMREIADSGAWAKKLKAVDGRTAISSAETYYSHLRSSGCAPDVWRTTYYHRLAGGTAGVVEWFKGTGLRPFIGALNADEREAFLARYHAAMAVAYPPLPDGAVLLPFPRLFLVAVR